MAKLLTIEPNQLRLLSVFEDDTLVLPNVVSITKSNYTEHDLALLKQNYRGHDVYQTNHNEYFDIHFHNNEEVRIIINGIATFYVAYNNILYVAECHAGDKIVLYPNIDHWFSSTGELCSLRFFKGNTSHIALSRPIPRIFKQIHQLYKNKGIQFKL